MNLSTAVLPPLAPDAAIDLQLHTTHSDGRWTPDALLDYLRRARFGLAAVTDHDCVDTAVSLQQLAHAKRQPLLIAAEMTTRWHGQLTDLLCFGFDPAHPALNALAQDVQRRQRENSQEVIENLQRQGFVFAADAATAVLAQPGAQQPHALIDLLKAHGHGQGAPPAGQLLARAGCRLATSDPAAVVDAAHQGGGVCLIAHPGRTDGFTTFDAPLLDQFRREMPVDGLEVYYPLHTPEQTAMYRAYAERHDLLISAGSDSHGPDRPPIQYRAELCRRLLERLEIRIT